jgi:cysteine desulfurase
VDTPTYLDYNATTPVDARALEAMLPWFTERFWNPASSHPSGRNAAASIEAARAKVADAVGAFPAEIIWTAGATEANNLAIKGLTAVAPSARRRILVAATEHKAVLDPAEWLLSQGFSLDIVPVEADGSIDIAAYTDLLDDRVAMVSVMLANNETGAIAPLELLADLAHSVGAVFHTDATQGLGRVRLDLRGWKVDAASFSAHKAYGPKGAGALYLAARAKIAPQMHGGGHERGHRSGTSNVAALVGFGVAAELAAGAVESDQEHYLRLTDALIDGLERNVPGIELVGPKLGRLSNTVNLRFIGADAEAVMANAYDVAVSSGSACSSLVPSASHVLRAMGLSESEAFECIRFSVGRPTTSDDISRAVRSISAAVERVRRLV